MPESKEKKDITPILETLMEYLPRGVEPEEPPLEREAFGTGLKHRQIATLGALASGLLRGVSGKRSTRAKAVPGTIGLLDTIEGRRQQGKQESILEAERERGSQQQKFQNMISLMSLMPEEENEDMYLKMLGATSGDAEAAVIIAHEEDIPFSEALERVQKQSGRSITPQSYKTFEAVASRLINEKATRDLTDREQETLDFALNMMDTTEEDMNMLLMKSMIDFMKAQQDPLSQIMKKEGLADVISPDEFYEELKTMAEKLKKEKTTEKKE